jgi:DNA-binding HxlR family transcriptional regulator
VSEFRYPQFCPLARSAEILGERWTLLLIRELLLGPIRFSELRRRLAQVSPSVLSERVQGLEARGLIERRELPPPASVSVIKLTPLGETLRPVVTALTRFGLQLLGPPELDDQFEPSWLRLGFPAIARSTASPSITFAVTIKDGERDFVVEVSGGPEGTTVRDVAEGDVPEADVRIRAEGMIVMALASGALDPAEAVANRQVEVAGRSADLSKFSRLFDFGDADRVDPTSAH